MFFKIDFLLGLQESFGDLNLRFNLLVAIRKTIKGLGRLKTNKYTLIHSKTGYARTIKSPNLVESKEQITRGGGFELLIKPTIDGLYELL
jgi:hypothetical protein